MAHIEEPRRNADGTWSTRVRYRVGGRGTPLLSHPILALPSRRAALSAAQHWANDFERKKYLGELGTEQAGRQLTCGEFVEIWMSKRVVTELGRATEENYKRVVPLYFTAFFGSERLSEVDLARAYEWREWMVAEAAKRSRLGEQAGVPTVNRMIQIGKGIFSFAIELGYLKMDSPLAHLPTLPYRQDKRRRLFAPTPEEVEAIRSVISKQERGKRLWVRLRDRALVSMMAYEGLRQFEAYPARWWQALDNSRQVRFYFIVGRSKARAGEEREVELWEPIRQELRELYLALGRPGLDTLIFPGVRGAVLSRRNWARDVWQPALENTRAIDGFADLPHFGPHKLRAGCASLLGYALTPKHVMLEFLGHEQETTTIKHYLRAFKDARAKLREGVPVPDQIAQARALFGDVIHSRVAGAG